MILGENLEERTDEIKLFVVVLEATCKAPFHAQKQSASHAFLERLTQSLVFSGALFELFLYLSSHFGWYYPT